MNNEMAQAIPHDEIAMNGVVSHIHGMPGCFEFLVKYANGEERAIFIDDDARKRLIAALQDGAH